MYAGIKGSAEQDCSHEAEAVIRGTGQNTGLQHYKYVHNTNKYTVAIQGKGLKQYFTFYVLADCGVDIHSRIEF